MIRYILSLLALFCIIIVLCAQLLCQHQIIARERYQGRMKTKRLEHQEQLLTKAFTQEVGTRPMFNKTVTATAYTARAAECDSTPWFTASMTPSRVGVIAVSRDLEAWGLTLGKMVIIEGMGLFRVEDRMNARWSNRIDILHANPEAARRFGKKQIELLWIGG